MRWTHHSPRFKEYSKNPSWFRDELILALEFYLRHRDHMPGKESPEIVALSQELNALARVLNVGGSETFRNPNGVYMKLMNFRRLDPAYTGKGGVGLTRGGKGDKEVWDTFFEYPDLLRSTAAIIRSAVADDLEPAWQDESTVDDDTFVAEAPEGRVVTRLHRARERNSKLAKAKKAAVLKATGNLACEACGFDFEHRYGERGRGFAECHHVKPVSTLAPGHKTRLDELDTRKNPWRKSAWSDSVNAFEHGARSWMQSHCSA